MFTKLDFTKRFCRTLILLFMFAGCSGGHSRKVGKNTQDSLFSSIRQLLGKGELQAAISLNENFLQSAYKNSDGQGIVLGCINMGNIYSSRNDYKDALLFLNKANTESNRLNNPELNARLYLEYAVLYGHLGLGDKEQEYFAKTLVAARTVTDPEKRAKLLWYYNSWKATYYEGNKQFDSLYICLRTAFCIEPDPNACSRIAHYFIDYRPVLDSAQYYLHIADSLFAHGTYPLYYQGQIYQYYGKLNMARNKYDSAIAFYLKSSEIFNEEHKLGSLCDVCNLLHLAYEKKGDRSNSYLYLNKYTLLTDSLSGLKEKPISMSVKNFEWEEAQKYRSNKRLLHWIILAVTVLFIISTMFLFKRFKAKEKKKNNLLAQKEIETKVLQKKVNNSLEELIALAKQGDANFYTRFREVYPEFHQSILNITTSLSLTELTLCAYIYLNFQTKEIAEYTFKSMRTIQNGKYNIRKKLNLSSDIDIYVWLKNLNG